MKLKKGDSVKCILAQNGHKLHKGYIYHVQHVEGSFIYLVEITGGWLEERFELFHPVMDSSEYEEIMRAQELVK